MRKIGIVSAKYKMPFFQLSIHMTTDQHLQQQPSCLKQSKWCAMYYYSLWSMQTIAVKYEMTQWVFCHVQHLSPPPKWKWLWWCFLSFVYICIAVGDPIIKRGGCWYLTNRFNPSTLVCLFHARTWNSNVICGDPFVDNDGFV